MSITFFWPLFLLQQVHNFGDPFILVIHEGETLEEMKTRIQKKLHVPDDDFAKVCMSCSDLIITAEMIISLLLLMVFFFLWCYPVEVCFFFNGTSRLLAGHRCCLQSLSGKKKRLFILKFSKKKKIQDLTLSLLFENWNVWKQRKDVYGAWEQYLGVEHVDNAPKRAYHVRHSYLCLLSLTLSHSINSVNNMFERSCCRTGTHMRSRLKYTIRRGAREETWCGPSMEEYFKGVVLVCEG